MLWSFSFNKWKKSTTIDMRFLLQLASEKEELVRALASEMSDNSKLKVIQACLYLVVMEMVPSVA